MAIADEIKQETRKMKDMSFKGKVSYIWEYFKIPIISVIVIILLLSVLIRDWIYNNKPVYLYALFINSNFAYENNSTIEADYITKEGIDLEENNLYIDFSLILREDGYDQLTIANQQKIMALYTSGELDSVIGPEKVIEAYAQINAYADLMTLLPYDLVQALEDKGYEFYDYTSEGTTQTLGIYMDNCEYLNQQGREGTFSDMKEPGKRPIFTISINSPNPEHAIEFLRMLVEN